MGNRARADYAPPLARALAGDRDALVRGHAAWALGRVACALPAGARAETLATLAQAARSEDDAWAREEVALALDAIGARVDD
jgi:hypothetical protein